MTNIPNSGTFCKGQNASVRIATVVFSVDVATSPMFYELLAVCDDAAGNTFGSQAIDVPVAGVPLSPSIIMPVVRISDSFP